MKKKIKDLTIKEMIKICRKTKYCDICPLAICSKELKQGKDVSRKEVEVDD